MRTDEFALRKDFLFNTLGEFHAAQVVDIKEDVVDTLSRTLPPLLGGLMLRDMFAVFTTQMCNGDTGTLGVTLTHIV